MRYIRRQVLDQRAPTDRALYVDISGEVVMNRPYNLTIPKGTSAERAIDNSTFVNGMIRYNTSTDQFEGYQAGAWRSFRFKEPGNIILQNIGTGDAIETIFVLLNPNPFATLRAQSGTTWYATKIKKNLVVITGTIWQVAGANFNLIQNPPGKAAGTYIQFGTPPGTSVVVYVYYNFDA